MKSLAWITAVLLALCPPAGVAQEPTESQVKAAFLFNFVKFIEWPEESLRENGGRIRLCVLGAGPFAPQLERMVAGKSVNGRALEVVNVSLGGPWSHCQMLFVGSAQAGALHKLLDDLRGDSVLTVGEGSEFLRQGGAIRFFLLDNHVRFEINLDAAEQARLKISSKLLALAQSVRGGHAGGG